MLCVSAYAGGVAWMGAGALPEDLGPWLAVSGLYLLLLLSFLALPVSVFVYHRIDLTEDTLRVGREHIPVAGIDPQSVRDAARVAAGGSLLQDHPSALTSGAPVRGRYLVETDTARLVGGGWAVPLGMSGVVIGTRSGEQLRIACRRPEALLDALTRATGPAPAP